VATRTKLSREQLNRPTQYGYRRSLVDNWRELIAGDTVLLLEPGQGRQYKGTVDAISTDGTLLWLLLDDGDGRKLFHRVDGYQTLAGPQHHHRT
jgi:hypothetical protein